MIFQQHAYSNLISIAYSALFVVYRIKETQASSAIQSTPQSRG